MIVEGGLSIAIAEASKMGDGSWYLNRVFVRPHCRGRGLGSKVLRALLDRADADVIVDPGGYNSDYNQLLSFYSQMEFRQTPLKGRMRWEAPKKGP